MPSLYGENDSLVFIDKPFINDYKNVKPLTPFSAWANFYVQM